MSEDLSKQIFCEKTAIEMEKGYPDEDIENDTLPLDQMGSSESKKIQKSRLSRWLAWLQKYTDKANVEARGVEKLEPEDVHNGSLLGLFTLWVSGNMVITSLSIGMLGPLIFDLVFWDSVATIICINVLGALSTSYFSTFGPPFGLRQMFLSMFWCGSQGVKIYAALNVFTSVCFAALNAMTGAQVLHTVNNGSLPPWAGVLIIIIASSIISLLGYKVVIYFEKYGWILVFAGFLVVIARLKTQGQFVVGTMSSGKTEAGNVLSFASTVFGFVSPWCAYSCDYSVYLPPKTKKLTIFAVVMTAMCGTIIFGEIIGVALAMCAVNSPYFMDQYNSNSLGGLLYAVLVHDSLHGFGQFVLVVLGIGIVTNCIPTLYSCALSSQAFDKRLAIIPRAVWVFIWSGVGIAVGIPAYYRFSDFLQSLMNIIGYWIAMYEANVIIDHFIFRKGEMNEKGYNLEDWADIKNNYPFGIASIFSFCCGVGGATVGMNQTWWVGPIAKRIGDYGGDVGFELSFAFCAIGYLVARPLERRWLHK